MSSKFKAFGDATVDDYERILNGIDYVKKHIFEIEGNHKPINIGGFIYYPSGTNEYISEDGIFCKYKSSSLSFSCIDLTPDFFRISQPYVFFGDSGAKNFLNHLLSQYSLFRDEFEHNMYSYLAMRIHNSIASNTIYTELRYYGILNELYDLVSQKMSSLFDQYKDFFIELMVILRDAYYYLMNKLEPIAEKFGFILEPSNDMNYMFSVGVFFDPFLLYDIRNVYLEIVPAIFIIDVKMRYIFSEIAEAIKRSGGKQIPLNDAYAIMNIFAEVILKKLLPKIKELTAKYHVPFKINLYESPSAFTTIVLDDSITLWVSPEGEQKVGVFVNINKASDYIKENKGKYKYIDELFKMEEKSGLDNLLPKNRMRSSKLTSAIGQKTVLDEVSGILRPIVNALKSKNDNTSYSDIEYDFFG